MIEFRGVTKSFGAFIANSDINFQIEKGQIHCLVGENGAGKSTLMNCLFGLQSLTSGQILISGKEAKFSSPLEAKRAGLGMVHQHFQLAGALSALDHMALEMSQFSLKGAIQIISRQKLKIELEKLSQSYHMPIPWDEPVEKLSVGIQQRLEILKILWGQADILILDEPTAVLTPLEIDAFFNQLRQLKASGKTILLITHKLREVFQIADFVTVLRKGKAVHSAPISDLTEAELAEWIIGRAPVLLSESRSKNFYPPILQIKNLDYVENEQQKIRSLNLKLHPGEILGIAGVEGNGQSELLNLLMRPQLNRGRVTGQIIYENQDVTGKSLRHFNVSYLPENRLHQGLMKDLGATENFLLGQQDRDNYIKHLGFFRMLNSQEILRATEKCFQDANVNPKNLKLNLGQFSGGNQQKFVVGRELARDPKVLIAAHPTRGVDIGSIEQIHSHLLNIRNKLCATLLISSELDELLALSDRILVFFNGQIAGELARSQFDEKIIGRWMTSGASAL
jgi:simple sugar transport system ATP-binding protein